MIKGFVGCVGGETDGKGRVCVRRILCVCGEYCVGEGEGEERGGVRLLGSHVVVLQVGSALRECILANG
jgi:hypothetical protein